jgi:hypothetical protein
MSRKKVQSYLASKTRSVEILKGKIERVRLFLREKTSEYEELTSARDSQIDAIDEKILQSEKRLCARMDWVREKKDEAQEMRDEAADLLDKADFIDKFCADNSVAPNIDEVCALCAQKDNLAEEWKQIIRTAPHVGEIRRKKSELGKLETRLQRRIAEITRSEG